MSPHVSLRFLFSIIQFYRLISIGYVDLWSWCVVWSTDGPALRRRIALTSTVNVVSIITLNINHDKGIIAASAVCGHVISLPSCTCSSVSGPSTVRYEYYRNSVKAGGQEDTLHCRLWNQEVRYNLRKHLGYMGKRKAYLCLVVRTPYSTDNVTYFEWATFCKNDR